MPESRHIHAAATAQCVALPQYVILGGSHEWFLGPAICRGHDSGSSDRHPMWLSDHCDQNGPQEESKVSHVRGSCAGTPESVVDRPQQANRERYPLHFQSPGAADQCTSTNADRQQPGTAAKQMGCSAIATACQRRPAQFASNYPSAIGRAAIRWPARQASKPQVSPARLCAINSATGNTRRPSARARFCRNARDKQLTAAREGRPHSSECWSAWGFKRAGDHPEDSHVQTCQACQCTDRADRDCSPRFGSSAG